MWLFIELYENNHLWTLKPVENPPNDDGKGTPWETVIHSAKVRFNCEVNIILSKNIGLLFQIVGWLI